MRRIYCLALAGFLSLCLYAQDRSELESERKSIQQEIQRIQDLYNQAHGETRLGIRQISLLNRKIELQDKYVRNIGREISLLTEDIAHCLIEIRRLENQLDGLRKQYTKTVLYAYKNQSGYEFLSFIFSSTSFNDAIKRFTYLKAYRLYRQTQIAEITQTKNRLAQKKVENENRIVEKHARMEELARETRMLQEQKKEKNAVVATLKSRESDLKKQLAVKKKRDRELQDAIAAVIRRDLGPTRKEANTRTATKRGETTSGAAAPASLSNLNAADMALGREFEQNKGKLPWPVDKGAVSIRYGKYKIPGTNLEGVNSGLTITAQPGSPVKTVFDGEVRAVFDMGDGMAVTIRHGRYYTTYAHLAGVAVKKGDRVQTGQPIGQVAPDPEHKMGEIDFILMIEMNETDPEPWLR